MEPVTIVSVVIFLIYAVMIAVFSYQHGKYRERMNTSDRSLKANEIFFAKGTTAMIANWRTASDLLAYVAGYRDLPDEVTYDHLIHNPNKVTFKRVDKVEKS